MYLSLSGTGQRSSSTDTNTEADRSGHRPDDAGTHRHHERCACVRKARIWRPTLSPPLQTLAPLYSGCRGGCSVTKRNFPVGQRHALQGMASFPGQTEAWRKQDARHHWSYTFSEAECHIREVSKKPLAESAWKMLGSLSAERPKRGRKRTECENFMRKSFHSCRKI